LVLEDEEIDRRQALRPMITYESVRFPIYLLSIIRKRIFWTFAGIELLEIICAAGAIIL
jgi:hypothetical protein